MADQDALTRTLVELADTLVDDFDVVDLLTLLTDRCVEAFDVQAAGLMLAAPMGGSLRVMASSSATMRSLELYELQASEGPCMDCYRTGTAVLDQDLDARTVNAQLNHALNSRVIIEQAKGMLAERAAIEVDEAFDWLRSHARRNNLRLAALAQDFLSGEVTRTSIEPRDRERSRPDHAPT